MVIFANDAHGGLLQGVNVFCDGGVRLELHM